MLKNLFSNLLLIRDRPSTLTSYSICDLFIRHVLHLLICKFDIILLSLAVLTLLYKRIKCSRRQRLFSTSAKFMSVGVYLSLTDPSVTACVHNLFCIGSTGSYILVAVNVCARAQSHAWAHITGRTLVLQLKLKDLLYLQCPHLTVFARANKDHLEKTPLRERKMHPRILQPFTQHRRTVCLLPIACVLNLPRPLPPQPPLPLPRPSFPPLSRTQKGCVF